MKIQHAEPGSTVHAWYGSTVHAQDLDCWGLKKGEKRQIRNGKTGLPSWIRSRPEGPDYVDVAECPKPTLVSWKPWYRIGEGKDRDLVAARNSAIWPEATDEDLTSPDLQAKLKERLPQLLKDFRTAVESLGFIF